MSLREENVASLQHSTRFNGDDICLSPEKADELLRKFIESELTESDEEQYEPLRLSQIPVPQVQSPGDHNHLNNE